MKLIFLKRINFIVFSRITNKVKWYRYIYRKYKNSITLSSSAAIFWEQKNLVSTGSYVKKTKTGNKIKLSKMKQLFGNSFEKSLTKPAVNIEKYPDLTVKNGVDYKTVCKRTWNWKASFQEFYTYYSLLIKLIYVIIIYLYCNILLYSFFIFNILKIH